MRSSNDRKTKTSVRLNRYLAQCGIGSRRKCDELIASGHIFCNGERVTAMGLRINADSDRIEYHGKAVKVVQGLRYFALYKPREVMVTANDPQGRTTVYDLLVKAGYDSGNLRYVGRLDYQSEGLLLITSDGDLVHALTHPRYKIKKVYQVKAGRKLLTEDIQALLEGIVSNGQLLRAGAIRELSSPEPGRKQFWYEIDLFEGKNRQC